LRSSFFPAACFERLLTPTYLGSCMHCHGCELRNFFYLYVLREITEAPDSSRSLIVRAIRWQRWKEEEEEEIIKISESALIFSFCLSLLVACSLVPFSVKTISSVG
jgi:hypothetical protein